MCYLHPFDWICICFVYPGIYPFVSCSNFLKYRFFKGFFNDFLDFVGICSLFLYIISNFLSLLLARGLAILLIFSEGSVLCLKLCIVHLVLISLFSSMIFFYCFLLFTSFVWLLLIPKPSEASLGVSFSFFLKF